MLDRHSAFVEARWREGCRKGAQLWRELQEHGFTGGYDIVRRWAQRRRALEAAGPPDREVPSWRVPSSRRAARLLTTDAASLAPADRGFARTLRSLSPEIDAAAELALAFGRLVRDRHPEALDAWLAAAATTGLSGFADGVRRDIDAVRAAVSLPWSNGPVEGQINRLKMLKRQMFGRAEFDLLRQRVLHAA